jgi:hypothetical protein
LWNTASNGFLRSSFTFSTLGLNILLSTPSAISLNIFFSLLLQNSTPKMAVFWAVAPYKRWAMFWW